ncbi:hypothetical protein BO86DRAFT_74496 [Aspergillus japonicus CBS 114.51]|uniref:Uncharacterized protein n=1 Tax=Aspergillus japonicus CBS 114.51 TaxID=1448312 RepID=A0A8T8XF69_ASPJA|nr:hypothetical protein BO86DRAFT_74496 [Aspergillus japonicus CBS 114.51]RAH86943.1 hypothetical protein BO86DRAFT_74496 [Aspergillus japonicus CBS 114.51]
MSELPHTRVLTEFRSICPSSTTTESSARMSPVRFDVALQLDKNSNLEPSRSSWMQCIACADVYSADCNDTLHGINNHCCPSPILTTLTSPTKLAGSKRIPQNGKERTGGKTKYSIMEQAKCTSSSTHHKKACTLFARPRSHRGGYMVITW